MDNIPNKQLMGQLNQLQKSTPTGNLQNQAAGGLYLYTAMNTANTLYNQQYPATITINKNNPYQYYYKLEQLRPEPVFDKSVEKLFRKLKKQVARDLGY